MFKTGKTYNRYEAKDGILLIAYYILGIFLLIVKLLVVSDVHGTRLILLMLATATTACAIQDERKAMSQIDSSYKREQAPSFN